MLYIAYHYDAVVHSFGLDLFRLPLVMLRNTFYQQVSSLRQSFQQVASLNLVAKRVVANSAALCSGKSAWLLYCLSAEFLEKQSRIILPADHKGTIKLFEKATQSKVAKEARLTLLLYSAQASVSSQYLCFFFFFLPCATANY